MTTWVDFCLYAAFALVVWGSIPPSRRFTLPVIADRDPEWLGRHPDIERRLTRSRWFHRSCRGWGALTVVMLVAVQVGLWPGSSGAGGSRWELLKDVNSILLIAGLVYLFGCALCFERWLRTTVPLAARRQASLVRRSVDDHVPRPIQHAVYGIVGLHLAAWLLAGIVGRYASAEFWAMLAFQYVVATILLAVVLVSVRRRPNAMDRIFGERYRRLEVRLAFAAQLVPLMNGAARLYEYTQGATPGILNRLLHLALVALVAIMAAAVASWSRQAEDDDRSAPSTRSLKRFAVLGITIVITAGAVSTQNNATPEAHEEAVAPGRQETPHLQG
jgi:hypothetical protein